MHYINAGVLSAVAAMLMHTQVVLAELNNIGISITVSDRFYMTLQYLIGLLPKYCVLALISLAFALLLTYLRMLNRHSTSFIH